MQQHQRPTAAAPSVPIVSTNTVVPGQVPGTALHGQESAPSHNGNNYAPQT